MPFDETKVTRVPGGHGGGEFAAKGAAPGASTEKPAPNARRRRQTRAVTNAKANHQVVGAADHRYAHAQTQDIAEKLGGTQTPRESTPGPVDPQVPAAPEIEQLRIPRA